jgi:hypothetical protein
MDGRQLNVVSNALLRLIEIAGSDCEMSVPVARDTRIGVRDLIRTIWLASFGLALIGGLFATKIASAPVSERPAATGGVTVPGITVLRETRAKPDKIVVSHRGT